MKKFTSLLLFFLCLNSFAQDVWVNSYARTDGTVVPSHYRTNRDYTVNNNFTTVGNINPYTGKVGTLARDNGYPIQSFTNSTPIQNTSYNSTYNKPSYKINVTTSLTGGYGVPTIVDQVLENGVWKSVKEEKFNGYLYFDKNTVWFKRGQNQWLGRSQNFVEYNSQSKVYIYESEYGITLLDEGLRFVLFYDAINKTKRYLYVIGKSNSSIVLSK
ncbi:hypothetical protein [Flavobacterium sp. 1355]|uniref:hypothetical protein n=1 Tax=Flavobacterium sp. 1355 TaxID=2806571 RepID=UPI001AE23BB6|nr:hypothetical protein [Flavobacterium sp. 1355]MBP1222903.1 hypothetical protein [Flavobacterium sp. 1355]